MPFCHSEMYICSNPSSKYISLSQTTNEGMVIEQMKRSDNQILNEITSKPKPTSLMHII
jgi:hypothetical protein